MTCAICHEAIESNGTHYALPMYRGRVDWRSMITEAVCQNCHSQNPMPSWAENYWRRPNPDFKPGENIR